MTVITQKVRRGRINLFYESRMIWEVINKLH